MLDISGDGTGAVEHAEIHQLIGIWTVLTIVEGGTIGVSLIWLIIRKVALLDYIAQSSVGDIGLSFYSYGKSASLRAPRAAFL